MEKNFAEIVEKDLMLLKNDAKAKFLQGFFKTGKGEYAEGDLFLGIVVPEQRKVAKRYYKSIDLDSISTLLKSSWHEYRLTALILLVLKVEKEKDEEKCRSIFEFYLNHLNYVNNWDLVDLSAPYIMGKYLIGKDKQILHDLAASNKLWEQRIAVVTNLYFIRKGEFNTVIEIVEKLVYHKHDLIHKAVGWVLRELGKKDIEKEKAFLDKYYTTMPRTMLRYAIERFDDNDKQHYMGKKK